MTASDVESRPAHAEPPPSRRRRSWWLVAAAFVVAIAVSAVIAVVVVTRSSSNDAGTSTETTLDQRTRTAIDDAVTKALEAQGLSVAKIYQQIAPSLVEVDVQRSDGPPTTAASEDGAGLGTGVIVNQDGSILTAFHVVDGADSIDVVFADGTHSTAEVASSDPQQDIAVLTAATLPSVVVPAVLGGGAVVGDPVVAVGNPLGLDGTTTSGVVSGLDRTIKGDDGSEHAGLIQFDAAVNPGSSGGPLLNARGETIGIVVALANPADDGFFIGIGFAVPIGTAVAGDGGDEPPK